MAQVTSGLVSVEDGIKKAEEYAPPRKVRVELSFSVEEGESFEAIFDAVSQAANNRVAALLSGVALAVVEATTGEPPAGEPAKRTRRTKAQIEADKAAEEAAKGGASPSGSDGGAQTSADDFDPTAVEGEPEADTPAETGGDFDPTEFDVAPESEAEVSTEITDADLNSAVQKKNGELQDPPRIRELIGSYNPDPTKVFQLRQIPQEKRTEFLKKLAGLKKAG